MATNYDPENNTFSHIGVPFNYTRGNPLPLDNSSIYTSLSAAQQYASTSPVAYIGQIVTVVDSETSAVDVYKINADSSLSLVAPLLSIDVDDLPISGGTAIEITTTGYINAKVGDGLSVNATTNEIDFAAGNCLSVVDGVVEVNVMNLFGGSATDVDTPIIDPASST